MRNRPVGCGIHWADEEGSGKTQMLTAMINISWSGYCQNAQYVMLIHFVAWARSEEC